MLTIRAMSDGKGYSAKHLANNDYYAEGERITGEWQGRGAELLGLNGAVSVEDFEAVRQGLDPKTKAFLRARQSADRIAPDGTTLAHGRSLYDFTFSAPKSVSILAILNNDPRLTDAHRTAVEEALGEAETQASARVRQRGSNADRLTGNLVVALYHHDASRELDPQIHTHAVAANMTFDGIEGRWKALQASVIYQNRAYLTEVYRNALARQVRSLGYEIESKRDGKGNDCGFEIRGVPLDLIEKFSERSRQRDRAIAVFADRKGRQPSNNEIAVLVRESRAAKLVEISTAELRKRQRAKLNRVDERTLRELRGGRLFHWPSTKEQVSPSFEYGKEHIFERVSVASVREVLTEALRHGRGQVQLSGLKGELAAQEASGVILRQGDEIATKESLQRERDMVSAVNQGIGRFRPLGGRSSFAASNSLRPEQKRAIKFVLQSTDRAVNISGAAGTGKTATLQELRRGLVEAGHNVIAVAPTMSAVEELQKVGFADALTLERLLQDSKSHAAIDSAVVILDEAGMASGRQMSEFLAVAEKQNARIVFSGDTKQIRSVEAGDALRILEKESRLKTVSLTEVQRQTKKDYRDAMEELRKNPERGFAKLDAIGVVREVPVLERPRAVARAYGSSGNSCLVVCATHNEIETVTGAIREERKQRAELACGSILMRHVSLNLTAAQKANLRHYKLGQLLAFHRPVKGIAKNETVEVIRLETSGIAVRTASGEEQRITAKQAKSFDVVEARPVEILAGDRLLLMANRREPDLRFTNGEIVTVSSVDSQGRVKLEDGRTIPANYRNFAHGYAITAHRSQGKSVDSVIVAADGMDKELFYVAASRGRQNVTVITSDKDGLKESIARSMARKSASELVGRKRPDQATIACRGLAAARSLVRKAAEFVQAIPKKLIQQQYGRPAKERKREYGLGR